MTKQEAKEIALNKLMFYSTQPVTHRTVEDLPEIIKNVVNNFHNYCPLCELFCSYNPKNDVSCKGCPLVCPSCNCNNISDEGLQTNIALVQAWNI